MNLLLNTKAELESIKIKIDRNTKEIEAFTEGTLNAEQKTKLLRMMELVTRQNNEAILLVQQNIEKQNNLDNIDRVSKLRSMSIDLKNHKDTEV